MDIELIHNLFACCMHCIFVIVYDFIFSEKLKCPKSNASDSETAIGLV